MAFKKVVWGDDKKLKKEDFLDLMPFALENNRHEFIREFIEREDIIESYLTIKELFRLYKEVLYYCN